MTALDEILTWSKSAPAWLRDALRRVVGSDNLSDADVAELAELCKLHHGLADTEAKPDSLSEEHLPAPLSVGAVVLTSMTHVSDVNALAPNETLTLAPSGLTVIYGDNGTGKSGFSRILRRACRARGAKDPILANAMSEKPAGVPTARLDYAIAGSACSEVWKDDAIAARELSAISVFDSSSAQVYVSEQTEVRFRPFGLDVVDRTASACGRVKKLLEEEITALRARAIKLPTIEATTEAGRLVAGLTALTAHKEVDRVGTLTEQEEKELVTLAELLAVAKAEDPAKKAADLRVKAGRLSRVAEELETLSQVLSDARIKELVAMISDAEAAEADARRFADEFARELTLDGVGSTEWTSMWDAAKGYSETCAYPSHAFPNITRGALCPLCQQELQPDAQTRLQRFAEFAVGAVRETARRKRESASKAKRAITELEPGVRNKEGIADLQGANPDLAQKVETFLAEVLNCHAQVVAGHISPEACKQQAPSHEVAALARELLERADQFTRAANPDARAKSEAQLAELTARKTLADSVAEVHAEIDRQAKLNAYDQCIKDTDTRALTKLGSDLTKKYVTDALTAAFDAELKRLGFTALELELKPGSAQRGQLLHKIRLKYATKAELPKVVSEGENRCIALAAFMAELESAGHNSGMVFDDPVSSLDHQWRSNVARRLVEAARTRQVIVFTHELVFLWALIQKAEELGVPTETRSLSRDREFAGRVTAGLPFQGLSAKRRIGILRERWVKAEKVFRTSGQDDYDTLGTRIYAELRQTWERAVEEILLNQVVLRFRPGIETQRLKKIGDIRKSDLEAVEQGMTKCSKWEGGHDQALAMNERLPSPDELKLDIDALETWISAVERRRK